MKQVFQIITQLMRKNVATEPENNLLILKKGFEVWNQWRQQNPQIIPDFSGMDLSGLKLFKVNLTGANLSKADFSQTSLCQANLSKANLTQANLSKAILQEADLSGANLIEANLEAKKFPQTNLSGANLSRANLREAKFYTSTILYQTDFSSSNLSGADLSGLNLRNNNFSGANLSQANLEYASLREVQILEAIIDQKWYLVWDIVNNGVQGRNLRRLDLSRADLEGANLSEADLHQVNFRETKLNKAILRKSILVKANFNQTNLSGANLSEANLSEANLVYANLSEANLNEANLSEANLEYASLRGTQIQKAIIDEKWYLVWDIVNNGAAGRELNQVDLSQADLGKANLKKGNFSEANLSQTILSGANLSWSNFNKANFRRADLTKANLNGADFSQADLSQVLGFDSITCKGTNFSGANLPKIDINTIPVHQSFPVKNKKEFWENLLIWKNKEAFHESIEESMLLAKTSFIPGILLYTDEDEKLAFYIRENFDSFDRLTGDWCTIYLLENPSPKWKKFNYNWRQRFESGLPLSWFGSKPYDKSEAYDIARQLDIEPSSLPCLVLISPANLSEKLIFRIEEVSAKYFRQLFSICEKLGKDIISKQLEPRETSFQVFECLKNNFAQIVNSINSKENEGSISLWKDKLSSYQREEAITADPEKKFQLKQLIKECQQKIKELGG